MFFTFSKIFWLLVQPLNFIALLFLLSCVLFLIGKRSISFKFMAGTSVLFLVLGIFPVGMLLLYPLEHRYERPDEAALPEDVDGIILLGGMFNLRRSHDYGYPVLNESASRMIDFIALSKLYPSAKVLYTGGSSSLQPKEGGAAYFVKEIFDDAGRDEQQLLIEPSSRNTYENYLFSKKLADPKDHETWILITSAFHMPRAVTVFCSGNWSVIPYPSAHYTPKYKRGRLFPVNVLKNYHMLHVALREWTGIVAYRAFGKTAHLLAPLSSLSSQSKDSFDAQPIECQP